MDEAEFTRIADALLARICDAVDAQLDEAEAELNQGVLEVDMGGKGTYILSKHAPSCEIWLSSPRSGAHHFAGDDEGRWVSTRSASTTLEGLLAEELGLSLNGRNGEP